MTRSSCPLPPRVRATFPTLACLLLFTLNIHSQDVPPRKFTVRATATVQESPARIILSWPNEGDASSYTISRRTLSSGWEQVASIGGGETSFSDGGVNIGTPYEYQIVKRSTSTYTGYGYLRAGIRVPGTDDRGKIILMVENGPAGALGAELDRLQRDLVADGWQVIRRTASMNDSPPAVKEQIRTIYN